MATKDLEEKLFQQYHKAFIHMRQRLKDKQFILCFGAGLSLHWGCPNWDGLVNRIAKNPKVKGDSLIGLSHSTTTQAQLLFEHFKSVSRDDMIKDDSDRLYTKEWIRIIHNELYKNCSKELKHPYLGEFIDIIKEAPVTINYNFDDYIERSIIESRKKDLDYQEREYETIWEPSTQFKRQNGVIYHPNGFLPYKLIEGYSEHFVFTESAYADQLLASMYGHYNTLFHLFCKYSILFIGLSLTDPTLKHLLHQNAKLNPGHYHYYVYFLKKNAKKMSSNEMDIIRKTYFNTYNLIVLFLNDDGLCQLGKIINYEDDTFKDKTQRYGLSEVYRYYISGAPGTGKTSALKYFKSVYIYNEWPDPKVDNLDKEDSKLSEDERKEVDLWISNQFRKKNIIVDNKYCIQLIDRSPLDPLTYAQQGFCKKRANELKKAYAPGRSKFEIQNGQIILLTSKESTILSRLKGRNSKIMEQDWVKEKICKFNNLFPSDGKEPKAIYTIDTSDMSMEEMVRKIGEFIFLNNCTEYKTYDMTKLFKDYCQGKRTLEIPLEHKKTK